MSATLVKTSCFTAGFHRFDHSSNDGFQNCFLKIAVPRFSKFIIRETTTISVKKKNMQRCSCFEKTKYILGSLVGNACRNSYKIVTEISEENRVNSFTGSE